MLKASPSLTILAQNEENSSCSTRSLTMAPVGPPKATPGDQPGLTPQNIAVFCLLRPRTCVPHLC
jgi:hypothetical protein